jgi:ABC-2 type transport system ATP-binding protein/lipopolysaccharide transport system ATP-binding protein
MASIRLRGVHVEIPIYNTSARSLKKQLVRATTGGRIQSDHGITVVRALNGIDLELNDGDRLGLVGSNGAGKTTLLRVLAGVYEPTRGSITVAGSIMPLLDVAMGIDMDSTGMENIMLRGRLLGIDRRQLLELRDQISEFTELGEYIHMPVRTYSSGMVLRLAFGISTCVTPEIVLMDEYFAVGDARFMRKAERRLIDVIAKAGIIVFASHSGDLVRRLCNKALWVHAGEARALGSTDEVLAQYAASG